MGNRNTIVSLATFITLLATSISSAQDLVSKDLDTCIQLLENHPKQTAQEKFSIESALDALYRLSNSPLQHKRTGKFFRGVELAKLQNTVWKLPKDDSGFQQTIKFGNSTGSWHKSRATKPYSFNWLIVPGRIRISNYVSETQIQDRTYDYTIENGTLTLVREKEQLVLNKWNLTALRQDDNGG